MTPNFFEFFNFCLFESENVRQISWSGWCKKRHHNLLTILCNSDHSVILGSKFHFISEILRQRGLSQHTHHSHTLFVPNKQYVNVICCIFEETLHCKYIQCHFYTFYMCTTFHCNLSVLFTSNCWFFTVTFTLDCK